MSINSFAYLLIGIGYLVAITGIFKDHIPTSYKKTVSITVFIMLTVSSAGQFITERLKDHKAWSSITSGRLVSKESTAALHPIIKVGGGGGLAYAGSPEKPALFNEDSGDAIFVKLVNGEARITVSIRDSKGAVLATVRDNEWFVPSPAGASDRNFNQNTLEVLGEDGQPVLQLRIVGENAELAYKSYGLHGEGPGSMGPWLSESGGSGRTLFKYPSEKYKGQLAITR